MPWTTQTKPTLSNDAAVGYGDQEWGSSPWGGTASGTNWNLQTKPTDTWTKQTKAS